ncbi:hypothetical protein R80B4_01268 [Fibrobacteres bacterium R8-0-B4]
MILYHGYYTEVMRPDLSFFRKEVDFGAGFYTTHIREQAEKWSLRFKSQKRRAVVSEYEFDDSVIEKLSVLKFETYSEDWLEFVTTCRLGKDAACDYDLIIGGVANDDVFNTLQLYLDNLIPRQEAIKRLRYEKPNIQYCFKNQEVIDDHLRFLRSYEK